MSTVRVCLLLSGMVGMVVGGCGPNSEARSPSGDTYDTDLPASVEPGGDNDAPEVSRSVGTPGGIVVLWPRIVMSKRMPKAPDAETRALATHMQARLKGLVEKAFAGMPLDVRPEPERVCPKAGCVARSVGILLTRSGRGCSATVLVSGKGASPTKLVPWAGHVIAKQEEVAFRSPPEDAVRITDLATCDELPRASGVNDARVVDAIRAAFARD